jgi:hypothetical protein
LYQETHALVVEFPAEPLELRGEQEDVGMVELLGPAAPAAGRPPTRRWACSISSSDRARSSSQRWSACDGIVCDNQTRIGRA